MAANPALRDKIVIRDTHSFLRTMGFLFFHANPTMSATAAACVKTISNSRNWEISTGKGSID